jgi:hypothetical protein
MRATLSFYHLEGIDSVPGEVRVDGDRARVVDPESGRCLLSVERPRPG